MSAVLRVRIMMPDGKPYPFVPGDLIMYSGHITRRQGMMGIVLMSRLESLTDVYLDVLWSTSGRFQHKLVSTIHADWVTAVK